MPILSQSSRHSFSHRLMVVVIYSTLSVLGLTMIIPFMMTVTSSLSNNYDYQEFRLIPRYLYSRPDRFTKGLAGYFNLYSGWQSQFGAYFADAPSTWTGWFIIGHDTRHADALARKYITGSEAQNRVKTMAFDYADFAEVYPVEDCLAPVDSILAPDYLEAEFETRWVGAHPGEAARATSAQRRAAALQLLSETFQIPYTDFNFIKYETEMHCPLWQQSWRPPLDAKYQSFLELKQAFKDLRFTFGIASKWNAYLESHHLASGKIPFPVPRDAPSDQRALWLAFKRETVPATPAVPYALRTAWRNFLESEQVAALLSLKHAEKFDIAHYNALAHSSYENWNQTPFPAPADAPAPLMRLWTLFVESYYPLRLTSIEVTPELNQQYQKFLVKEFKTVPELNKLLGTSYSQWTEITLAPELDKTEPRQQAVWVDFVKGLPASARILQSSEAAFQRFMLGRYGDLAGINRAWGTDYHYVEEVFPPFDEAYAVTFAHNEWPMTFAPALNNYGVIASYLFRRSNALYVTLLLVALSILCTLTVNPFAAYALSRFNLRGQEAIILFLLATSAFPAMISAIPGYLLMRDLGLLNTFFALVLPGAASGMSIFILKGFFDSLPPELFEAATIDGAKEWQIFLYVTMPMVKPILAINMLTAFLSAYTGWEWALIICQNPRMWTLAVWMYQASQWWVDAPWIVSAGFIIISIPTLLVFLTCQKVILRGIIIPQMK